MLYRFLSQGESALALALWRSLYCDAGRYFIMLCTSSSNNNNNKDNFTLHQMRLLIFNLKASKSSHTVLSLLLATRALSLSVSSSPCPWRAPSNSDDSRQPHVAVAQKKKRGLKVKTLLLPKQYIARLTHYDSVLRQPSVRHTERERVSV